MKRYVTIAAILLGVLCAVARDHSAEQAMQLAKRLSPRLVQAVEFKTIATDNGADVFTLEWNGSKAVIGGNNANSMAVGLNHYLNRYCKTTVSWYADVDVELPAVMPAVTRPERITARVPQRFFLNYCTFGYTMPFWQWRDWERFIDWMALNGVNMPLAITGQEAVWLKVWTKLGMTEEQVRSYFTGPAYLPWHRMANIDRWCGPLPQEWLDNQAKLQKLIVGRERELNMRPVLPAFAGHVPAELHRLYPDADIKELSGWAGFDSTYHTCFLNSEDPLYSRIQKEFLEEQTRLYGTDHIYGVDPFNEVDPPSFEPEYLNNISRHIYESLKAVDPDANWLQMAWFLYYERDRYTPEPTRAMLTGVPQGKMAMLDYYCEFKEMWRDHDGFYGLPWLWCYLGNFGGNSGIAGNVKVAGERLEAALSTAGDNLVGIGSTLEGLDVQQFPYEYILQKAWNWGLTDDEAIDHVADRHAGSIKPRVRDAWKLIYDSVLVASPTNFRCPLPCSYPMLNREHYGTSIDYNRRALLKVWRDLAGVNDAPNALATDIVWVGRQLLGDLFATEKSRFDQAFADADTIAMRTQAVLMTSLLADIDSLNSLLPHATLDQWVKTARDLGETTEVKDYYEMNARRLITTWGGNLNDYACRNWSGLIRNYYAKRWQCYIDEAFAAVRQGRAFDTDAMKLIIAKLQDSWPLITTPELDRKDSALKPNAKAILAFSHELLNKYATRFFVAGYMSRH